MPSDSEAISATLNAYRDALMKSDADGCAKLYAEDGITMAQGFSTQVSQSRATQGEALELTLPRGRTRRRFEVVHAVLPDDSA